MCTQIVGYKKIEIYLNVYPNFWLWRNKLKYIIMCTQTAGYEEINLNLSDCVPKWLAIKRHKFKYTVLECVPIQLVTKK